MRNSKGVPVRNQFILSTSGDDEGNVEYFQSYDSIIVKKEYADGVYTVSLDEVYWDYSRTTSKYRSLFLNETTKETERKIKSGEYILCNLN